MNPGSVASSKPRIGLALSGGGFRASLFHLGVIRRLEELGIMEDVAIVSAVSGGSIVAAFYLCEMEKELREARLKQTAANRVELFERIAERFLEGVTHNLRTRALVYTPFYHPISFVKTLALRAFRRGARAELIQAEYDKWFYFNDTMDQLPVERPREGERPPAPKCVDDRKDPDYGPRLLLNTTSLLTGERKAFSRDSSSGIKDLKTSDKNVLPLSRVVGASSGVPVLFPPTAICGDLLVDGGISDNQGIEGLLDPESGCDVLLVSDASGQMQVKHTLPISDTSVYLRVNEIFQFQIRNKLLAQLLAWSQPKERSFAFIHLLVNLKSRRGLPPRVSTDILPALGQVRTDLDQFSPVESEALMYHGYTLIDAQLREYCCDFLQEHYPDFAGRKLTTPPLFQEGTQKRMLPDEGRDWSLIREDLEAGSQNLYLARCLQRHRWPTVAAILLDLALLLGALWCVFGPGSALVAFADNRMEWLLRGLVPDVLVRLAGLSSTLDRVAPVLGHILARLLVVGIVAYLASFPLYLVLRQVTRWLDLRTYRRITGGSSPTTHWAETEPDLRS